MTAVTHVAIWRLSESNRGHVVFEILVAAIRASLRCTASDGEASKLFDANDLRQCYRASRLREFPDRANARCVDQNNLSPLPKRMDCIGSVRVKVERRVLWTLHKL